MDKRSEKDKKFLEDIRKGQEEYKNFIQYEYPNLSFKEKVNYWYGYLKSEVRDCIGCTIYDGLTKKDYLEWKKQEPKIDKILKEVLKSAFILGINKRRFYWCIGKWWKIF